MGITFIVSMHWLNLITLDIVINQLTPALFWDTDIKKLSESDHAGYIIQRVGMLGTLNDWKIIKNHYGLEKISDALLSARYLDPKTLNYFSFILGIPKKKFRCFIDQQSAPKHWNY